MPSPKRDDLYDYTKLPDARELPVDLLKQLVKARLGEFETNGAG